VQLLRRRVSFNGSGTNADASAAGFFEGGELPAQSRRDKGGD
jgi:hypothetical protein